MAAAPPASPAQPPAAQAAPIGAPMGAPVGAPIGAPAGQAAAVAHLHAGESAGFAMNQKLMLGLSWDFMAGTPAVDLDAAALLFDYTGSLVDAAYYNQLQAAGGSVVHSGDEKTGESAGVDESIIIDGNRLPKEVTVIVIVLTAFHGGSLGDLETASAALSVVGGPKVADFALGGAGTATAAVMCALYQHHVTKAWTLKDIGQHGVGRNFMACMPMVRPIVDGLIDPMIAMERGQMNMDKTFAMHKGSDVALPPGVGAFSVGLGWSCRRNFDLDASVLLVGGGMDPTILDTVYFGNQTAPGVKHSGDNTTGAGAGDDETIMVQLGAVRPEVQELVFVVNIYTSGGSFAHVHDAYIRLVSQGRELARYPLHSGITSNGLLFAKLYRCGGTWRMLAVGTPINGRTAKDQAVQAAALGKEQPGGVAAGTAPAAAAGGGDDGCCVIQ